MQGATNVVRDFQWRRNEIHYFAHSRISIITRPYIPEFKRPLFSRRRRVWCPGELLIAPNETKENKKPNQELVKIHTGYGAGVQQDIEELVLDSVWFLY